MIKQTNVSEDRDNDVAEDVNFGFLSFTNFTERKGTQCAEQIKELILSFCENSESSMVEHLDRLFNDCTEPLGSLRLSETFINISPQMALPMH